MAPLPTLALGDFTQITQTSIQGAEPVLQLIASTDDAKYVYSTINSGGLTTDVAQFTLADMPGDFGTMDTLSVRLRYGWGPGTQVNTWDSLRARVFKSDGTTPLTDEVTLASTITNTTPANSSVIDFTGVDTAASKADWDGAVVHVSFVVARVMGGDTLQKRCYAAELTGAYTIAAPTFEASVTDANPVQTDSAEAGFEVAPTEATVTDENPAQTDSAAATHSEPTVGEYRIHRSTSSGFTPGPGNLVDTIGPTETSYEDTGLDSGVTYYYKVVADDGSGTSASNEASATTEAEAILAAVTDANPSQTDSSAATHDAPGIEASVTDSNPVQTDSATADHEAPVISASVTDANPAQSDSAEASQELGVVNASVTDSNPAQTDTATSTHETPVFEAAVTDQNPAQADSAQAVQGVAHEATVADSNPAQQDSATAELELADVTAQVTDGNPAQVDSATGEHLVGAVSAQVTDTNPSQTDVAAANLFIEEVVAAVTDSNPSQSDAAAVEHLLAEVTASVTDGNPAQTDSAAAIWTAFVPYAGPISAGNVTVVRPATRTAVPVPPTTPEVVAGPALVSAASPANNTFIAIPPTTS